MSTTLRIVLLIISIALLGVYLRYVDTKKKRQELSEKAGELTKKFGDVKQLTCFSVMGLPGIKEANCRSFFLGEPSAAMDSSKQLIEIDRTFNLQPQNLENMRKEIEHLINIMPYTVYMNYSDESYEVFFKQRINDQEDKEEAHQIKLAQQAAKDFWANDIDDKVKVIIVFRDEYENETFGLRGVATFKEHMWEPDTEYTVLYSFSVPEKQLEVYDKKTDNIISLCIPILDKHNCVEVIRQPPMRYGDYMDLKIECGMAKLKKRIETMADSKELQD